MLKHLLHIRKTWVKAHLENDITHIADRLKGGWAPRWRGSFTLSQQNQNTGLKNKAQSSKKWMKQTMKHYKNKLHQAKSKLTGSKGSHMVNECDVSLEGEIMDKEDEKGSLELRPRKQRQSNDEVMAQDYACDVHDSKTMYDGDTFYEAAEDENELLEEEEEDEEERYNHYHSAYG